MGAWSESTRPEITVQILVVRDCHSAVQIQSRVACEQYIDYVTFYLIKSN